MGNDTKVKILASQIVGGLAPAMLEMVQTTDGSVRGLILKYAILSVGWAAAGAAFFVSFFPERYRPGTFDKLVYSHGAMHVCVALSILQAFRGYTKVYRRTKF
jgi:predicted membrane channel-forming protein YqfA (hemolysin III family)